MVYIKVYFYINIIMPCYSGFKQLTTNIATTSYIQIPWNGTSGVSGDIWIGGTNTTYSNTIALCATKIYVYLDGSTWKILNDYSLNSNSTQIVLAGYASGIYMRFAVYSKNSQPVNVFYMLSTA
jgi:hypothetical protein